ncbi:MAG: acyltransferase [Bacteroidota bacterium]|nr:acyltransferase [Bacteroidota bacterium]
MTDLNLNKKPVHFVQLDALRFLAAFMVVFVHAFDGWSGWFGIPKKLASAVNDKEWSWIGGHLANFVHNFNFGVDIFFLISGFLITFLLIKEKTDKEKINIPAFFLRRVLRIWPLYFFVIAICFFWFVPWLEPEYVRLSIAPPVVDYKPEIFFYDNFHKISVSQTDPDHVWMFPFAHFWSISIEEHFYLVWPFLVALVPLKRLPVVLVAIIISSVGYRAWAFYHIDQSWFTMYLNTFARIDALAIGGLAAWWYFKYGFNLRAPLWTRLLFYAVLIWLLVVDNINDWQTIFMVCFKKVIYLLLIGLAMMNFVFNPEAKFRWGPKHIFNYLGRCCFGIYLWGNILLQVMLMKIFLAPEKPITDWLINHIGFSITYWLIVLSISLLVPIITYELLEKPFMKLKSRFAIVRTRI